MVQLTGHVRRYPSPLWSLRAARSVGPPVWHHLLSPLTGSQSQATAVCECAGVAWATPGRGWDIFPLMWVNNVINHPFGNGLYHFFMVMTGGWFMMVYYCFTLFTHMIYPFTSFSFVLFVNSRIKAQRAGWHCQCLRMSQIFDLWRSRGSEADGSCYSALTAWSWPKPQLKSCRVRRQGAKRLSGCQVQESHPVVLLWRDYSPCLAHLSWFSPAKLQAWSWLCVWNQAFASRRSQTSASAGCSKICTCSLACHYLSSTRRDPVSICFNTFNVSQKTWHTTTKTIRIQRCVSGQVKA